MRPSYYHSVWIDVFGVVLVGGAGYLLYHAGGAASGLGGGGTVATSGGGSAPAGLGARHSAQRPAPSSRSNPLFGGDRAAAQSGSGVEASFSEDWQKQATPDLTRPSGGASPAPSGGGAPVGEAASGPSGPALASRSPSSSARGGASRAGSGRSGWRTEARKFSGKARALAGQLGQMERSASEEKEALGQKEATTGRATSSSASSNATPGTPGDPSQVPIDGLGWLAAAGAAYALRRLGLRSDP